MGGGVLNLAIVRPWWLRCLVLLLPALPLVGVSGLPSTLRSEYVFSDILQWALYALFVWGFVALVVGLERSVVWLAIGTLLALIILFWGSAFRHLDIWKALAKLLQGVAPTSQSVIADQANLVLLSLRLIATVPLCLLILHSFPASDLLRAASRPRRASRFNEARVALAIFLRVFQHVFEVAGGMLFAWREENPGVVRPRHRSDWTGVIASGRGLAPWMMASVYAWSISLLQQGLLIVPVAVKDWDRIAGGSK